jgi:cytochrome c-type biogenesis protein
MTGPLAFAFAAGMLSTVNPCGFAMLPAFLAYYLGVDDTPTGGAPAGGQLIRRAVQGLGAGLLVSVGFAGVFTLTGLLVAAGLRSVIGAVPWIAVLIGVLLAVVGLALLTGRHVGVTLNSSRLTRSGRGPGAMLGFGAAYAIASLSCTLAVLLAVVAQALATTNLAATVAVFGAYAAGAGTVLVLLALSAALASGALAAGLHRASRYLPRVAGIVLLASGAYLVAYWAPALRTGRANGGRPTEVPASAPVASAARSRHTQVTGPSAALACVRCGHPTGHGLSDETRSGRLGIGSRRARGDRIRS